MFLKGTYLEFTTISKVYTLVLCPQVRWPLRTLIFTHLMPPGSTCNNWRASAAARPQAQKQTPHIWDMYVLVVPHVILRLVILSV